MDASTPPGPPPNTLPVQLDALPRGLPSDKPRWVNWLWQYKAEQKGGHHGGWTKPPLDPKTGLLAESDNPDTWGTLEQAISLTEVRSLDGIGYNLLGLTGIVVHDLDKCRNPDTGEITSQAMAIVRLVGGYWEITPSGTGVRGICGGTKTGHRVEATKGGPLEGAQYDGVRGRYITLTGHRLPESTQDIEPAHPGGIKAAYALLFPAQEKKASRPPIPPLGLDDQEVIRRAIAAHNGGAFRLLWEDLDGGTAAHSGDDSGADAGLMSRLYFWTGGDTAQMERLFSQSARGQRDKWKDRPDYRQRTVDWALRNGGEIFNPKVHANGHGPSRPSPQGPHKDCELINYFPLEYPVEALPEPSRRLVTEGAAAVGVPVEMVAIPHLAGVGAVIGNRLGIQAKAGYVQYPALWGAVVAEPGTAKSPAEAAARAPLDLLPGEAQERWETASVRYKEDLGRWMDADKGERGLKPQPPELEHYYTTDATVEAVSRILAASPGVLLLRDELTGWVREFDQYKSGKGGERQRHLSSWAGSPWKVDRKTGDPIFVEHPVIPVYGGVQPDMLPQLQDEAGRRDGFLERFLWSYPVTIPTEWSENVVSTETIQAVVEVFRKLRAAPRGLVRLSPAAKAVWTTWYNENARRTAKLSGLMAGTAAKLPNQVLRLALELHCLKHPDNPAAQPVSQANMDGAIALGEYHLQQAAKVFSIIAVVTPARPEGFRPRLRAALAGPEWKSLTDLHRKFQGHAAADKLREALTELVNTGCAETRTEQPPGAGRPRELYLERQASEDRSNGSKLISSQPSESQDPPRDEGFIQ